MDPHDAQARRRERAPRRQLRGPARFAAAGSLVAVAAVILVIVLGSTGGSGSPPAKTASTTATSPAHNTTTTATTGKPRTTAVPILSYRVINVAPSSSTASSDLYVPAPEFTAQMAALKTAGWHAVTLNQLQAYWTRGVPLGSGNPIVITFDGGFASQYTNALPVLKRLGWVGVVNLRAAGVSPSDGGLTDSQIHGLIAAGWELDAEGSTNLSSLDPTQFQSQVTGDRQTLRSRYSLPVNWFAYPSGRYDANLTAAARSAGFVGASTLDAGWANPTADRFRLPRLRVVSGTTPAALLSQIASAQQSAPPPPSSPGV